jgi:hypothetical protein
MSESLDNSWQIQRQREEQQQEHQQLGVSQAVGIIQTAIKAGG